MATYTKPQQLRELESERLREKRDKIKFIDLGFERGQAVGFRKASRRQKLHVLWMNDDLWDRVREVGIESWNGCE